MNDILAQTKNPLNFRKVEKSLDSQDRQDRVADLKHMIKGVRVYPQSWSGDDYGYRGRKSYSKKDKEFIKRTDNNPHLNIDGGNKDIIVRHGDMLGVKQMVDRKIMVDTRGRRSGMLPIFLQTKNKEHLDRIEDALKDSDQRQRLMKIDKENKKVEVNDDELRNLIEKTRHKKSDDVVQQSDHPQEQTDKFKSKALRTAAAIGTVGVLGVGGKLAYDHSKNKKEPK